MNDVHDNCRNNAYSVPFTYRKKRIVYTRITMMKLKR